MKTIDYEAPKPRNRNIRTIRILLVFLCILVICTGVSLFIIYKQITSDEAVSLFENQNNQQLGTNPTDNSAVGAQNSAMPTERAKTVEYNGKKYVKNEDIVNLLFLGIDSNESREDRRMGKRSDVTLVCAVDTKEKAVTLISLPRDLKTTVYKLDADRNIKETVQNRVNTAYSFAGTNEDRPLNAMKCVEMFLQRECQLETPLEFALDIPVYLYAAIDMEGIAPVAQSVGGVEVTLEYSIPGVGKKGQTVLLKGQKAEIYLTDRKNTPGGDIGRASKEQDFMIKLAKKIKSKGAVDLIVSLWDDLNKYVDTSLNLTQMKDFAKILLGVNLDDIKKYTIPGKGSSTSPYFYLHDEEETLQLLLDVYYREVS